MEYVKLSVSPQAARQLRRVTLELGEIEGRKVSQGHALEVLTGDWLAKLYRARDAGQAAAQAGEPDGLATEKPQSYVCTGCKTAYFGLSSEHRCV